MTYHVHEMFATLQGEGAQTGMPAVFLRFAGCNLWSGREEDRQGAVCRFCDTLFVGTGGTEGGRFESAAALAARVERLWPGGRTGRMVVVTGGEPLLQLDPALIAALGACGFRIAVETNGTIAAPAGIDWLCVSPKAGAPLLQCSGDELKLVYPQAGLLPPALEHLPFSHFFLQPMDGPQRDAHVAAAIAYVQANPRWRLSLQTHKLIGIR
jgi:7-carboxy-7-deazaguanine synthase (Cx14CxxC type)